MQAGREPTNIVYLKETKEIKVKKRKRKIVSEVTTLVCFKSTNELALSCM
jgi:hypothetical protein